MQVKQQKLTQDMSSVSHENMLSRWKAKTWEVLCQSSDVAINISDVAIFKRRSFHRLLLVQLDKNICFPPSESPMREKEEGVVVTVSLMSCANSPGESQIHEIHVKRMQKRV